MGVIHFKTLPQRIPPFTDEGHLQGILNKWDLYVLCMRWCVADLRSVVKYVLQILHFEGAISAQQGDNLERPLTAQEEKTMLE